MLKEFVKLRQDKMIETLQELLRINSSKGHPVSGGPFGEGPTRALEYMLSLADSWGFRTKNLDGYCGYVEYGDSDDYVAVLSHLDVVPAGEGWTHPAFGADIAHGRIYGRGAIDDKGPAMSTLWALIAMKELGIAPKRKIRLIFGLDEESDWKCMDYYFRYEPKPLGGFTPDGHFPLIYAEKGLATLRVEVPADAESMAAQVLEFSGGDRWNMVPDRAKAKIDCHSETAAQEFANKLRKSAKELQKGSHIESSESVVSLVVEGKSAHASTPEVGVNAILSIAHLLSTGTVSNSSMWRTVGAWEPSGKALGIDCSDNDTGSLTMTVAKAELRDGVFQFFLNIRFPVTYTVEQILQTAKTYLPDRWHVSLVEHLAPLRVDPESNVVQTLMNVYHSFFDDDRSPETTGGATYARTIPNAVAFGAEFPEKSNGAHEPDEYWEIDEYLTCVEIYTEAMTRLANSL